MTNHYLKILYLTFLTILISSCHGTDFDSKKWKNFKLNSKEGYHLRWDMSEDLINNYDLTGMDTTEIFNLLGTEHLDCFNGKCTARYVLGGCRRGIDVGTLELTFKNGKVTEIFKHCN